MFLETERMILRKVQETDFEGSFREYLMDREIDRMMCRNPSPDMDAARLSFDWFLHKEERSYVLVRKEGGKVIGNLTVYNSPPPFITDLEALKGKTGRSLSFAMSRQYQRQGLMSEAVNAVIDCLFQAEGVDYINCGYLSVNEPSRELQRKLGFSYLITEHIPAYMAS